MEAVVLDHLQTLQAAVEEPRRNQPLPAARMDKGADVSISMMSDCNNDENVYNAMRGGMGV